MVSDSKSCLVRVEWEEPLIVLPYSFIVDALDSLLVLGMVNEYERAREWVKDLSFDVDDKFHTFEVSWRGS